MLIADKASALLEPVDVHVGGENCPLKKDDRDQDEASTKEKLVKLCTITFWAKIVLCHSSGAGYIDSLPAPK